MKPVERSIEINASPVRVWKCLTSIDDLRSWFGSYTKFEAREGGGWEAQHGKGSDSIESGVIRLFRPFVRLEQTWKSPSYAAELLTIFTLKANPRGTLLAVREEGFDAFPAKVREKLAATSVTSWRNALDNLKKYAEMKGFPAADMVGSEGGATS